MGFSRTLKDIFPKYLDYYPANKSVLWICITYGKNP